MKPDNSWSTWDEIRWLKDANGVEQIDYVNLYGLNLGVVYNPAFITSEKWLKENCEHKKNFVLFPYKYDWYYIKQGKYRKVKPVYYSADTQANALKQCKDESFREKIVESFANSPINDGDWWFQGFCKPRLGGNYILNSHVIGCIALMEENTDRSTQYAMKGVKRLEQEIDKFMLPEGLRYDLWDNYIKKLDQHPEYKEQLLHLAKLTNSLKLEKFGNKLR